MFWSFSDNITTQSIQFIVGLILARILSPSEFGLVGMVTVFLALAQSLVDSGFSQALIRKSNPTQADFSTVFYFNFLAGLVISIIFYIAAPAIAHFYKQPDLVSLARVLGVIILINSTSFTQRTILTRRIDFKLQMKISFISAIISGILAIILALRGYGVWSLVWKTIIASLIQSVLLWYFNKWIPALTFSKGSLKALFSFGSKLLLSGLIDTIYKNIYMLVIGKVFSANELGFYSRADQFSRLPTQNITGTVQRVSYPVLSMVQDDTEKLKTGYRRIIFTSMFITFFSMLGLAAMAKSLIIVLIGEKWLPAVVYLQLLCLGEMLYPLQALNLNILNVRGRSDLFLRIEIIKKLMVIPVISIGIFLGIRVMLIGMIIISFIAYYINSYYSGRLISYSIKEQIADILPTFLLSFIIAGIVFSMPYILKIERVALLLAQVGTWVTLTIIFSELFNLNGYIEIKLIIHEKIPFLKGIIK
jgi:teichuronic acid exporter